MTVVHCCSSLVLHWSSYTVSHCCWLPPAEHSDSVTVSVTVRHEGAAAGAHCSSVTVEH